MFRRKKPDEEFAAAAVPDARPNEARAPDLFEACGIPDTLDGRFDSLALHAALVIDRLRREPDGEELAQAFFDVMFRHLDLTLREIGVQDLGVGRRIKIMAEGFHGRALAYREALAERPDVARRGPCAAMPMAVGRLPRPNGGAARGPCPAACRQLDGHAAQRSDKVDLVKCLNRQTKHHKSELERIVDLDRMGAGGDGARDRRQRQRAGGAGQALRLSGLCRPFRPASPSIAGPAARSWSRAGLRGKIVQACILTLDPVTQELDETFRVVFKQDLAEETGSRKAAKRS